MASMHPRPTAHNMAMSIAHCTEPVTAVRTFTHVKERPTLKQEAEKHLPPHIRSVEDAHAKGLCAHELVPEGLLAQLHEAAGLKDEGPPDNVLAGGARSLACLQICRAAPRSLGWLFCMCSI